MFGSKKLLNSLLSINENQETIKYYTEKDGGYNKK
jgi:hypothetical protein